MKFAACSSTSEKVLGRWCCSRRSVYVHQISEFYVMLPCYNITTTVSLDVCMELCFSAIVLMSRTPHLDFELVNHWNFVGYIALMTYNKNEDNGVIDNHQVGTSLYT